MAVRFYVDFRFHGYSKEYAKWAISRVHREAKRLGIRGQRPLPHISLFGPAETNSLRRVIADVERIGRKYTLVPFKIDGFSRFDEPSKVIYLDIDPSPELEQLRQELAESLIRISKGYAVWDTKQRYKFHSTIGMFDTHDDSKFDQLYTYAENHCRLENFRQHKASIVGKLVNIIKKYVLRMEEEEEGIRQYLLRVTILGKGSRIQCEYDLLLKRSLSRRKALSRYWWRKTIERLRVLEKHKSKA
jgi:2'-5' RNA ligase